MAISINTDIRICPICGNEYKGAPALSRKDNVTPICPLCGTKEALESLNISNEEKERILNIVRNSNED